MKKIEITLNNCEPFFIEVSQFQFDTPVRSFERNGIVSHKHTGEANVKFTMFNEENFNVACENIVNAFKLPSLFMPSELKLNKKELSIEVFSNFNDLKIRVID